MFLFPIYTSTSHRIRHLNIFSSFRDPLFSTSAAFIFRKGYEHSAKIDNELMWLDALGHVDLNKEETKDEWRNHGIWAPDSGSCDIAGQTRKVCELPFGSKFYTWGERDKGISNC